MKLIPLTQGKFAQVDDADFERVNAHKWSADKRGAVFYARRGIQKPDGKWANQYMHRFLMPEVAEVHHIDGDGLNNQRCNLQSVTRQQNTHGFRRKGPGATSKFRGVCWDNTVSKWSSQITVNYKKIFLGYFTDEKDAARAYDKAARKYFDPEFRQLNFP